MEQSRRDDLESLGMQMVYYAKKGYLPWMKAEEEKGSRSKLLKIKEHTTLEKLCEDLPECYLEYMKYCREIAFEQKPDYKYLKSLFDDTFTYMSFKLDYEFCWHF